MLTLLLLSVALATDAFAVAIARGAASAHTWRNALITGVVFGLCQAIAAILGWFVGSLLSQSFQNISNYIACTALVVLGVLMIRNAILHGDDPEVPKVVHGPVRSLVGLLMAGIVISLDCLAAGVALPLLGFSIGFDALVIFVVSLVISAAGYRIGSKAGLHLGQYAEKAGGLILIGIGLHLLA